MELHEITDAASWDTFVDSHAYGHPLQLWGWGEAKRGNGWTAHRLVLEQDGKAVVGAQVLLWPIPRTGRMIAYIPRGPMAEPGSKEAQRLLEGIVSWAKEHRALYVRVEPAWTKVVTAKGWRWAANYIQLPETYTIDLAKSEEELLEAMARKHRQYIRKGEREGLTIRRVEKASELGPMNEIYQETAARAGFGLHGVEYYENLFTQMQAHTEVYYAETQGKPVAFLWLAHGGAVAYELYGGVMEEGQEVKANYALKWHAITEMKAAGKQVYDFNGRLNEGVSRFKDGFGPDETDYIGTYDYPLNVLGYQLWERLWPVAKPIGRRILKGGRR